MPSMNNREIKRSNELGNQRVQLSTDGIALELDTWMEYIACDT
jgi:hypothetical protein